MRKLSPRRQILSQLALALVALFVVVPLWGMLYMAFDGSLRGWPLDFRAWPAQPTLDVFARVFAKPAQNLSFLGLLQNSLIAAGGAALLSVALGASMAYAFARYRFPGRQAGLFALLVGTLLPPVALMTPLYVLLNTLSHDLRTSIYGLVIVYTAFAMPFCVWNMRAAFQAVPRELEESALLDGASSFVTFWRVTLPLALPSIAVAALVAFLIGYSEFAIGWLFVDKASNVTLAMALSGMMRGIGQGGTSWGDIAALALLMAIPVVAVFVILQQYLLRSLLIGTAE